MPRVRAAAALTRTQRLQRCRRARARQWSDSRSKPAVLSVIATSTNVASAAAPAPAAAAAVPSVPVAAAAAAAPPLDSSWPVLQAMMCLRHREEFPLGPHCPRILQLSTNVLEAAAAQFARLRAELAAVPTAALQARVERASAACEAHENPPDRDGWPQYPSTTKRLELHILWENAVRAAEHRSDQLELMPRATVPCPDGCTKPDIFHRTHIPDGACTNCTTRDTESIKAHFSGVQTHSCFDEDTVRVHGDYGLRPLSPSYLEQQEAVERERAARL